MKTAQAQTSCNQETFPFQALGSRRVEVDFSGGFLSSNGGGVLLREAAEKSSMMARLAECFIDTRDPRYIEFPVEHLMAQRVVGIAMGYEDLNDHERLRYDPVVAMCCGNEDLLGETRHDPNDQGKALAGKSTLNRMELSANATDTRYKKIACDSKAVSELLIEEGVRRIARKSKVVVIDFDATDDPLHGNQEERFFNGYYRHYCYLPLYAFCGDIPLWSELRSSGVDGAEGTLEALQSIVKALRKRFGKQLRIILRADGGFCRDWLLDWIESQPRVHYVVGIPKNERLKKQLEPTYTQVLKEALGETGFAELEAKELSDMLVEGKGAKKGKPKEKTIWDWKLPEDLSSELFGELRYRTQKSWSRERRVIGKAAVTLGKGNPRFIVTDLNVDEEWAIGMAEFVDAEALYRKFYCARGDMENRIKEQQMDMFADRTSTGTMASNQLRLYLSTFAYMLMRDLREVGLQGTRLAKATVGTIRLRLIKIAAQLTVSVRRVHIRLATACPEADLFALAQQRLASWSP